MAHGIRDPVAKAFQEIYPNNPLIKLNDSERKYLWALLVVYSQAAAEVSDPRPPIKTLESMSKKLAAAGRLASDLESEVFQGPFSELLRPFTAGFDCLPKQLARFSRRLGRVLDTFGKPGHKGRNLANQFLIQASEFVSMRTGQFNDEHLAELFQAIGSPPTLEELSDTEGLSGAAIHKRRERFKEQYPMLYVAALRRAARYFERKAR